MVHGSGDLSPALAGARSWKDSQYEDEVSTQASPIEDAIGQSFSGKERNRLFYSQRAQQFLDLSAVSGVDNIADGRVLALLDFDRDGWQDMAVASANAPLLSLYRNEIGMSESAQQQGHFVALRFVGGSRSSEPSEGLAGRDGYGAQVTLKAGDITYVREQRCGEGMAGQNSTTMLVGIGDNEVVNSLSVRWPSGKVQDFSSLLAGQLLTVYERPEQSPSKEAGVRSPYGVEASSWPLSTPAKPLAQFPELPGVSGGKLRLYTTMATWCEACRTHLPELEQLRAGLGEEVRFYGVPVDEGESAEKLQSYAKEHKPAYTLLSELKKPQRLAVKALTGQQLGSDLIPASVVTDAQGKILLVTGGLPSLSQMRALDQS